MSLSLSYLLRIFTLCPTANNVDSDGAQLNMRHHVGSHIIHQQNSGWNNVFLQIGKKACKRLTASIVERDKGDNRRAHIAHNGIGR